MALFVLEQMKSLPTQQHLDEKLAQIHVRTDQVLKKAESNSKAIESLDDRLKRVETGRPYSHQVHTSGQHENRSTTTKQDDDFEKAARSIRFWPIEGESTETMSRNLDAFMKNGLLMEECDLQQVIIDDIQIEATR